MTVFDLIKNHYSEYLFKLKKIYPGLLEFSKKVPVVPWKDEYSIADRNPEVIAELEKLENLLSEGKITEEEYRKRISEISHGYSSITKGISFIPEGIVSFRDEKPSIYVILHELGHVYFGVTDYFWSATYGGAEILFWLGLEEKYGITEENVRLYLDYLKRVEEEPEKVGKELEEKISSCVDFPGCARSLYAYLLYSGLIPEALMRFEREGRISGVIFDPSNPELERLPYTKEIVREFLFKVVDGLRWGDSFGVVYARCIGVVNMERE